ncbi:hypothetical protein [Mycolicibacterium sp. XJ870]
MPSRKPSSPVLDSGDDDVSPSDALALAEQAEAEAEEAEAVAAAARAKARAIRLRNQAAAEKLLEADEPGDDQADAGAESTAEAPAEPTSELTSEPAADIDATDAPVEITDTEATELTGEVSDAESEAEDIASDPEAATADEEPVDSRSRLRRIPRLFWKVLASVLTILVICGLLAFSGWMIWQHRQAEHRHQLMAEYSAAARQSVVTLMSLDFNHAQDDVKRILDNSTGEFRADFEGQAEDFVKLAQDAKVVTEATANAAAVDTMTDNTATVLVAVNTSVTNTSGAKQEPRPWRVAVDLVREGDQIKLSKVEFVP